MSKPVYAEVGSSAQQIGGTCPQGWVEMTEQRPSSDHVAQEDGSWLYKKPVPQSVTRRQAKQQLYLAGLLSNIQSAIDAIEDETERALVQIYFDDAVTWERTNSQVEGLGSALGLTDDQIDDLFISAAKL